MSGGLNLPHGLIRQRDDRGSPFSSLLSKMCLFAKQSATYKGRGGAWSESKARALTSRLDRALQQGKRASPRKEYPTA
jgi:hypothetical protein